MTHETEPNDAAESIVFECDLAEPLAQVWRALTEPELLSAWLMPNDIRPEVGARFTFQAEEDAGSGSIECEVLAVEPLRLLRYSWRGEDGNRDASDRALDSTVTFVLAETPDGGTHLRLVHDGFPIGTLQSVATRADSTVKVLDLEVERTRRRPLPTLAGGGLRWAA
jgi:uncharacterized protein YndB with AHSA1/START domain